MVIIVVWVCFSGPMDCSQPGSSVREIFQARKFPSRLPFPPSGNLPDPGIEPTSLVSPALAGRFFAIELPGKPSIYFSIKYFYWFVFPVSARGCV